MNESEMTLIEKWKDMIPDIDLEYFIHQVKPEYQNEFFQKMYIQRKKMDREINGGNKGVHKIND